MLAGLLIYALIGLMIVILVRIFLKGSLNANSGASGAALTALHDLQPKDKQQAVEMIILEKAGAEKESQKSGAGSDGDQGRERNQGQ